MQRFSRCALTIAICTLTANAAQPAQEAERGKAVIVGRVVDGRGKPMAGIPVFARTDIFSVLPESFIKAHTGHGKNGVFKTNDKTDIFTNVKSDIFTINGYIPEEYTRLQTAHAVTGTDGTYRFTGVTTARYQIMLDYKENQPREWTAVAIQNVPAKENETVAAPDLILQRGALVTGTVRDNKTHRPLAGALVEYMGPSNPNMTGPFSAVATHPNGIYSLRLAPGANSVFVAEFAGSWRRATPKGYWVSVDHAKPHFYAGLAEAATAKISVRDGETHTISFSLADGQ